MIDKNLSNSITMANRRCYLMFLVDNILEGRGYRPLDIRNILWGKVEKTGYNNPRSEKNIIQEGDDYSAEKDIPIFRYESEFKELIGLDPEKDLYLMISYSEKTSAFNNAVKGYWKKITQIEDYESEFSENNIEIFNQIILSNFLQYIRDEDIKESMFDTYGFLKGDFRLEYDEMGEVISIGLNHPEKKYDREIRGFCEYEAHGRSSIAPDTISSGFLYRLYEDSTADEKLKKYLIQVQKEGSFNIYEVLIICTQLLSNNVYHFWGDESYAGEDGKNEKRKMAPETIWNSSFWERVLNRLIFMKLDAVLENWRVRMSVDVKDDIGYQVVNGGADFRFDSNSDILSDVEILQLRIFPLVEALMERITVDIQDFISKEMQIQWMKEYIRDNMDEIQKRYQEIVLGNIDDTAFLYQYKNGKETEKNDRNKEIDYFEKNTNVEMRSDEYWKEHSRRSLRKFEADILGKIGKDETDEAAKLFAAMKEYMDIKDTDIKKRLWKEMKDILARYDIDLGDEITFAEYPVAEQYQTFMNHYRECVAKEPLAYRPIEAFTDKDYELLTEAYLVFKQAAKLLKEKIIKFSTDNRKELFPKWK